MKAFNIILIALLIIMAVVITLYYYINASVFVIHTTISTSTTTNTTISTSTTTISRPNFTENVTINTMAINKTNVLFGSPNQSEFEEMYFTVTPGGDFSAIYGLNFTYPIMAGPNETSPGYVPNIPSKFKNVTYPVAIYITITTYTAPEALKVFNNWYNPAEFTNGTYYINATRRSSTPILNSIPIYLQSNYSYHLGNASCIIDLKPMYGLDNYIITYVYDRNFVSINTYGIIGKYNYTYAKNIANHIYEVLSAETR